MHLVVQSFRPLYIMNQLISSLPAVSAIPPPYGRVRSGIFGPMVKINKSCDITATTAMEAKPVYLKSRRSPAQPFNGRPLNTESDCLINNNNECSHSKMSRTVHPFSDSNTPTVKALDKKSAELRNIDVPAINIFTDQNVLIGNHVPYRSSSQADSRSVLKNNIGDKPRNAGALYISPIKKHCPSASGELYVSPVNANAVKIPNEIVPVSGNSKRTRSHFGNPNRPNSVQNFIKSHVGYCHENKMAAKAFIADVINDQMTSILKETIIKKNNLEELRTCVKAEHIPINKNCNHPHIQSSNQCAINIFCNRCCIHGGHNPVIIVDNGGERVGEVYGSFSSLAPPAHTNISSIDQLNRRKGPTVANAPVKMLVTEDPTFGHQLQAFDQHSIDPKGSHKVVGASSKYVISGEYRSHENEGFQGRERFEGSFNFDTSFADPGYVSEKSDYSEDEQGVAAVVGSSSNQGRFISDPSDGSLITLGYVMKICPFITYENIFYVNLTKNSRGLGLSVTGGIECDVIWSGLVRIKNIFPQTPAALCDQLDVGDVLLEANDVPLTGLSSHEALEVLRTSGVQVKILGCRPPSGVFDADGNSCDVAPMNFSLATSSLTIPSHNNSSHFLIPSPSYSTYGDFEINIAKVNGSLGFTLRKQDNSILGHTVRSLVKEPALSDGRIRPGDKLLSVNGTDMCGLSHEEAVKFLRTCPETVVLRLYRDALQTPVSPASPTEKEFFSKPKQLRKEARDMLTDLAFRKQSSSSNFSGSLNSENAGSNRRRRLQKTPSPDINATSPERWDSLVRKSEGNEHSNVDKMPDSNESEYNEGINSHYNSKEASCHKLDPSYRPKRPNFLDLTSQGSCSRKARLTPPIDDQSFDIMPELRSPQMNSLDSVPTLASTQSDIPNFNRAQPSYHSVNLGALPGTDQELTNTTSDHDINSYTKTPKGLLKWKGVVFTPEEEDSDRHHPHTDSVRPQAEDLVTEKYETVTINFSRGWNSRLGFSLQPRNNKTVIVDVYSESLAARDGRLKIGDEILKVNGESVSNWKTEDVIEMLRRCRGKICLEVKQAII